MDTHEDATAFVRNVAIGSFFLQAATSSLVRFRGRVLAITHENIAAAIGVTSDEVRGKGCEGDETPVGADRGVDAIIVRLHPCRPETDPLGLTGCEIAKEEVRDGIGIAGDKVGGGRAEDDEPPVDADFRLKAAIGALLPGRAETDTLRLCRLAVARTNTSSTVSPATRLVAEETNAT